MIEEHQIALTLPTIHFTMNEDASLLIKDAELLAKANVESNKPLNIVSLTNPQGTLINNNNGTWSFTPSKYFSGTVILNCLISDGEHEAIQKIKVKVVHVSHPFESPEVELFQMEDGSYLISSAQLLQNGTDIEGDNLEIVDMSTPQGYFINNNDGTWTLVPSPEYMGAIDLQFMVSDGKATVKQNLVVTVNTPPFMPEIDFLINENDSVIFTSDDLIESTVDIDGDLLSVTEVQTPNEGQIINNDNGTWTYLPPENYVGPVQLQFGVTDNRGVIVDQSINIYTLAEDRETVQPKSLGMQPDGTVIITADVLLGENDVLNAGMYISNLASAQGMIQQYGGTNKMKWIFIPNKDFADVIDLQYTIGDGTQQTAHSISIEILNEQQ